MSSRQQKTNMGIEIESVVRLDLALMRPDCQLNYANNCVVIDFLCALRRESIRVVTQLFLTNWIAMLIENGFKIDCTVEVSVLIADKNC